VSAKICSWVFGWGAPLAPLLTQCYPGDGCLGFGLVDCPRRPTPEAGEQPAEVGPTVVAPGHHLSVENGLPPAEDGTQGLKLGKEAGHVVTSPRNDAEVAVLGPEQDPPSVPFWLPRPPLLCLGSGLVEASMGARRRGSGTRQRRSSTPAWPQCRAGLVGLCAACPCQHKGALRAPCVFR
jgi:hypothetical protein